MYRRRIAALLALAIASQGLSLASVPTFTVVPNSYGTSGGGTSATYPFSQSSMRYQQVFDASQFSGTGTITQISFRAMGSYSAGTLFMPTSIANVTITLSTTSKNPGGLSTTFADNITSTPTTVFSGTLQLSSSCTGPSGGPYAFDTRIYLTTPFTYDPSQGNLLMDVTINPGAAAAVPTLDAETTSSSPATSRVYATSSAATTGKTDNKGIITQFSFGNFAVPTASGKIAWLIFTGNVTGIDGVSSSVAQHFFNNANTLIAGAPSNDPIPSGYSNATPLANYNSFSQFQSDLLAGAIDSSYTNNVVMYDNESWSKTPSAEQAAPASYEMLFANLAHAYGYVYLTAPSPDLTGAPPALPSPTRYDDYLNQGYPAFSAGAPSEAYDIQAQKLETDPSGYQTFGWLVGTASSSASTANPATLRLAGITTTPFGTAPTASQLAAAVTATYDPSNYIGGYWFNIPDGNYTLAEAALEILQGDGY